MPQLVSVSFLDIPLIERGTDCMIKVSLTDDPSEETEGTNIEERTEESSAEPEGGNTEPTVRRSQRETRKPNFYEEAMSCSEKEKWKEAMEAEFQFLQTN